MSNARLGYEIWRKLGGNSPIFNGAHPHEAVGPFQHVLDRCTAQPRCRISASLLDLAGLNGPKQPRIS